MSTEMAHRMRAIKCPTDELSLTNRVIVNAGDFTEEVKYVLFFLCELSGRLYKFPPFP